MKKPDFRPLAREDFPSEPWIERLIRPLNTVLSAVATGLGNGLTLGENLNAEVKTIDVTTRDEWVAPTFQNGWVDFGAPYAAASYMKAAGRVHLRGAVKNGTLGSAIFTLPTGYAPSAQLTFAVIQNAAAGAFGQAIVNSAGGIFPIGGSNTFYGLDGISFYVDGASPPNPAFPVRFKTRVTGKVAGVQILRCVELQGRDERVVHESFVPQWSQSSQTISLEGVSGLTGGRTYRLTLAVIGG
jgi:hypothetical protein